MITTYINYGDFVLVKPTQVVDLLKGFGVTEQEEKRIWTTYSRWVLEKVMREGNIDWPNKETHKKRYPFLVESTDITTKFVEKIPDIIRESSVPKYLSFETRSSIRSNFPSWSPAARTILVPINTSKNSYRFS